MKITGKCSWFGGPQDEGVSSSEDLAFWEDWDDVVADHAEELFLPQKPPGTTGLARRLNPEESYIACRWDYDEFSKASLASGAYYAAVKSEKSGKIAFARPCDWGPNEQTGRICDLSPGLMEELGLITDDVVTVTYPGPSRAEDGAGDMAISSVVISAGHGKNCPGAEGLEFDEEDETPIIMHAVAEELRRRGVTVMEFWDQQSDNVSDNLDTIIAFHNVQPEHDLDVSCHFNSSDGNGHGVEVLYLTQEALAAKVSAAIARNGFSDRGAKLRQDLAFLNRTKAPAILIETCFSDNVGDVEVYQANFDAICASIATAISGVTSTERPPPDVVTDSPVVGLSLTVPAGVTLRLTINGEELMLQD